MADQTASKHKTAVEGYEDQLPLLAERIHRMRYDTVEDFYRHVAEELRRQAKGDRGRGRHKLAALLEEAATTAEQQQERFARIWALCKPHM
jgi:phosphate uptake regulator